MSNLGILYDNYNPSGQLLSETDHSSRLSRSHLSEDNTMPEYVQSNGIAPALFSPNKTSFPVLQSGMNITAFQQPADCADYIQSQLNPPISATTSNGHRSSVNDSQYSIASLKNPISEAFFRHISTELKDNHATVSDSAWIRELFPKFDQSKLHENNPLWDQKAERLKIAPKDLTETFIKEFLSDLIKHLHTIYAIPSSCGRSWDERAHNTCIAGNIFPKPNICLVSKVVQDSLTAHDKMQWPFVEALTEITSSPFGTETNRQLTRTITEKSFLVFHNQPWRRFFLSLAFFGPLKDIKWSLILCDRAGVVSAGPFKLDASGGLTFVRVLYFLAFGTPQTIGIDETMEYDTVTGTLTAIHVKHESEGSQEATSRTFKPIRMLHNPPQMIGRATRVWLVEEEGKFYVLKDSWILVAHPFSEIKTLKTIHTAIQRNPEAQKTLKHCYPILVAGQDLGDSTDSRRMEVPFKPPARVHRRIVSGPVGDSLNSFRCKKEFALVIRDIVKYLQFLNVKCNIIHGDISFNNLRINRVWPSGIEGAEGARTIDTDFQRDSPAGYGLAIDNDYSFEKHQVKDLDLTSGTLPFMSLAALHKQPDEFVHSEVDDLESLLYSVLTVCMYTTGPGVLRRPIPKEKSIPMNKWFSEKEKHELVRKKSVLLNSFDTYFASRLPEYWKDFTPYLQRLLKACWEEPIAPIDQPNAATHDKFIKILDDAVAKYETEQEQFLPCAYVPSRSSNAAKRPLEGSDDGERNSKLPRRVGNSNPSSKG